MEAFGGRPSVSEKGRKVGNEVAGLEWVEWLLEWLLRSGVQLLCNVVSDWYVAAWVRGVAVWFSGRSWERIKRDVAG